MKKSIVVVLAIAMLGFFGVAQAASDMPDILGSIETSNYQTMSDGEMDQVVGEAVVSFVWCGGSIVLLDNGSTGVATLTIPLGGTASLVIAF
jgi:hypothetical protein